MALLFVYMMEFVMADEEMPDPDPDSDSTSRARSKAELAERALAGSEPLMLEMEGLETEEVELRSTDRPTAWNASAGISMCGLDVFILDEEARFDILQVLDF
jgi:hypothetical protein